MLVRMGKLAGIDYGAKRVGVAISDTAQSFAFPKTTLTNDDSLLDTISELVDAEEIEGFVLGESDNPAGGMNAIMRRITIFAEALKVRTGLPVFAVSEAYSSAEARRALEEKVRSRADAKTPVDAAAAAIILQTYLDINTNTNHTHHDNH
jgi:putative Holliday junction resolvase